VCPPPWSPLRRIRGRATPRIPGRARLRRVLHGLRSFFRGREGAEQEGLLAERTLLISRSARREERSRPESPGAGADERD
jgi:hypothetical protein